MGKRGKKKRGICCHYCKRPLIKPTVPMQGLSATKDHIVPRSEGGRKTVPCCFACNNMKGDMPLNQWLWFIGKKPEWWKLWKGHPNHPSKRN